MPRDDRPVRVLLIDDDRDDYLITKGYFDDMPGRKFTLEWVAGYDAGLAAVAAGTHDAYLLDYHLGARTGLELLLEARQSNPLATVLLLTGQGEYEVDRKATRAGAADYLEKGKLDATLLERALRHALLQKQFETELEAQVRERTAELERLNARLETEVRVRTEAEAALTLADRRKDEFLATLAHELRNPLAPIRNALSIMALSAADPAAVARARAMMERQVLQMVRLIDDLLDVSRITRGKLQLALERVPLAEVLDAALEISAPQIATAGLTLVRTDPPAPVTATVDRVRIAQVFSNLLNNAAKYTEAGGTVTVETRAEGAEAVVVVRDTGVGIPAENLPHVFELFTQIDRSLNRAQGGLGIGLALVSRLVGMHGGRVAAESAGLGRGAAFTVRLPLAPR